MIHWRQQLFLSLFYLVLFTLTESVLPAAHFTLERRGDLFGDQQNINLTRLVKLVKQAEKRFDRSSRTIKENKVTRTWKPDGGGGHRPGELLADIAGLGSWFANIEVGDPPQNLEFDLDMLLPDFLLISTTRTDHAGSKYDSFASKSHTGAEGRIHPECRLPTDDLHLTNMTLSTSINLRIPMCGPPKYTRRTLMPPGNVLGLAPSSALTQTTHSSFVEALSGVLPEKIWSVTLIDATSGILSIGSTIAGHLEEAKIRTQVELQHAGLSGAEAKLIDHEVESRYEALRSKDWHDHFRWLDVYGAGSWWTTLMQGMWVDGKKIMKNQPILLDIQVPFILAPPLAASKFYEGISGSKRLEEPFHMFFAYPCHNQPSIAFEFDAWMFPTMAGERNRLQKNHGPSGGRFSLGKERPESGYCIGVVVETRMGLRRAEGENGEETTEAAGNGMRDLWIVGEPFFHRMVLVFDIGEQKIGFRSH